MKVVIIDYGMGNIKSIFGALKYLGVTKQLNIDLEEYLETIKKLNIGEIYLNSIDQDGTSFGYDYDTINTISNTLDIPLIIAGGAGNEEHLIKGLEIKNVNAVATANLFNFIADGLPNAREKIIKKNINLAKWSKNGHS